MTIVEGLGQLDQEIVDLFRKYEEANRGSTEEKRQLATEIFLRLHIHVGLAEALLYEPLSLVSNDSQQALIEDKLGEPRVIASLIGDLRWQDSTQQDHKDGFGLLAETVERHIKEEEETVFAKAVDVLGVS